MTPEAYVHAIVRVVAVVLWLVVVWRTNGLPPDGSAKQTRRWASTLLVLAFTVTLAVGSLVNFGILDLAVSRFLYTATAFAVITAAIAILSLRRE